jgi:excisionase family DNA binding protein
MDAPAADVEPLITVRQAARRLGLGRHILFRAGEAGELDIIDVGGWARVRFSAVLQWLERSRRLPRGAA